MNKEKLNFEPLLKVISVGNIKNKNFNWFTVYPLQQNDDHTDAIFKIQTNKWYHNFFRKQKIKLIKFYLKSRNKCSCSCHITPGFYHCWGLPCCDKENLNWRKL